MISIIAAIGKNRELGLKNGLVFNIKEDMKYFKKPKKVFFFNTKLFYYNKV